MCSEVPQSCYFVKSTYECKYIRIDDSMKCSQLRDQAADYLYNKISCASINYDFEEYIGELQCQKTGDPKKQDDEFMQQCRVEKYCKWDEDINTCQIMALKDLEWKQELRWLINSDGKPYEALVSWCEDTPIVYKNDDCRNIFSKGVCLQLSSKCVFDLTMGGCYKIDNNEQFILSCENIIGTNCLKSRNPNAPCVIDTVLYYLFIVYSYLLICKYQQNIQQKQQKKYKIEYMIKQYKLSVMIKMQNFQKQVHVVVFLIKQNRFVNKLLPVNVKMLKIQVVLVQLYAVELVIIVIMMEQNVHLILSIIILNFDQYQINQYKEKEMQ